MTEFYPRPDLAWVPIIDIDPLRIALAWREGEKSPLVPAFADTVRELAVRECLATGFSSQADEGTRTPDPLLTMEVLYQLSYVGVWPES
jgi:hypothetical protein